MGLMQKLFGGVDAPSSQPQRSRPHGPPASHGVASVPQAAAMRRELLRLALRQSIARNGIPAAWIGVEILEVGGSRPGIHIRLLLQHWEPRLLPYTLSFQHDLEQRLLAVEPQASEWLRGFSWQYTPGADDLAPMPDPGTWGEDAAASAAVEPAPVQLEPPPPGPPRKSKEELAQLFAQQDRSRSAPAEQPDFAPTQPLSW